MAAITDDDVQWYTERDIAEQTGLPGPYVQDLLPHLPTAPGRYSTDAHIYGSDSIDRAQLVKLMLQVGVRRHFIRAAIGQPMTADQLTNSLAQWTALADRQVTSASTSAPQPHPNRLLVIATLALAAITVLLLGVVAGFALGPQ